MKPVITIEEIESLGLEFNQEGHDGNEVWDTYEYDMFTWFVFNRSYDGYVQVTQENANNGNINRIGFNIKGIEDLKKLIELLKK